MAENETMVKAFCSEKFGNVRVVVRDGDPWFVAKKEMRDGKEKRNRPCYSGRRKEL